MEHRCGTRTALNVTVRLRLESGAVFLGHLTSTSLSGAFVETSVLLPIRGVVQVEFASVHGWESPPKPISAFVVRDDDNGVGLEWTEFAPLQLVGLLDWAISVRQSRPPQASGHADPPLLGNVPTPLPACVAKLPGR
ncbi:MAG TPA: hypothetical protein VHB68_10500 [Steroidobacteraceae bacterium]|nr:hypothetical protein [Steroidobacteraceae bacterium]